MTSRSTVAARSVHDAASTDPSTASMPVTPAFSTNSNIGAIFFMPSAAAAVLFAAEADRASGVDTSEAAAMNDVAAPTFITFRRLIPAASSLRAGGLFDGRGSHISMDENAEQQPTNAKTAAARNILGCRPQRFSLSRRVCFLAFPSRRARLVVPCTPLPSNSHPDDDAECHKKGSRPVGSVINFKAVPDFASPVRLVTSVSLPPFVSRRGLSNTNQRLSLATFLSLYFSSLSVNKHHQTNSPSLPPSLPPSLTTCQDSNKQPTLATAPCPLRVDSPSLCRFTVF